MTATKCPHCGRSIVISLNVPHQKTSHWHTNKQQTLHSNTVNIVPGHNQTEPAAGDWQKITPISRLEPRDITTAIYDASVSFGLITTGGGALVWALDWPLWTAPAAGFSLALWRYFGGIALAKGLLEIVENISNKDINNDGHIGRPEPTKPQPIPLEVVQKSDTGLFQRMFRFELPENITIELFSTWARGVLMVNDLTQARWVSREKFSRDDYTTMLAHLAEAGIIRRTGNARNASYVLTRHGRNALGLFIDTQSHSLTRQSANFGTESNGGE